MNPRNSCPSLVLLPLAVFLTISGSGGGAVCCAAEEEPPWAVTVYGAILSTAAFESTITGPSDFDASYRMVALALTRRLAAPDRHLAIEAEGQLARHTGEQGNWELNALLAFRWRTFPWNRYLGTSAAFGAGLSWASEVPEFERRLHAETGQALMYLLVEVAVTIPTTTRWAAVYRIHHRSGAYGVFDSVHGASNAVGLGIKLRF